MWLLSNYPDMIILRAFMPFPPLHVARLNYSLPIITWLNSTTEVMNDVHAYGNVKHSMLAGSLVRELAQNERYFEGLSNLDRITFAGGTLGEEMARVVSQHTKLSSTLGAIEYCSVLILSRTRRTSTAFDSITQLRISTCVRLDSKDCTS
jgi:hypothetical protein